MAIRWLSIVLVAVSAAAQTTTPTNGTDSPGSGATPAPTTPGGTPGGGGGGQRRPVFLSGKVMMDDGLPLPANVNIQSVCGMTRRVMAHVSEAGGFEFQWTNTNVALGDASDSGPNGGSTAASAVGSRSGAHGIDPLANCDIVADAQGYSSTRASLYNRGGQDNYNVGLIVLHHVGANEGHSVSVLALQAPKAAKKAYDKGMKLAVANKTGEAIASFQAAVTSYPAYADAWVQMGKVQWQAGIKDDARASFKKAMEIDSKLVGPWQELGFMACDDSKWEEAVHYLDQAVRLDPMDSPIPWHYDALANFNLGHYELAERSVRAELKLDRGKNPQAGYLLGLVLIARQDLEGGAVALRNYIATAPPSTDLTTARRELSRVENAMGR